MKRERIATSKSKPDKAGAPGKPAEKISKGKAELTDEELTKVSGGGTPAVDMFSKPHS